MTKGSIISNSHSPLSDETQVERKLINAEDFVSVAIQAINDQYKALGGYEPNFVYVGENYMHIDDVPEEDKHLVEPIKILVNNTDLSNVPPMRNFDRDRLETIQYLAKALSKQECLDYFGIVEELSISEEAFFDFHYNFGVSKGKREAMEKLFIGMGSRNGAAVTLDYLKTHADRFPRDGELNEAKGSFSFNVNMDDID